MKKSFEDICKSAEILQQNENYEAASELFLEALSLSEKPVEKIYIYTSLGKLFQKNKEIEKSIENFEKALPCFEGFNEQVFSEEQAVIHNNLGALYYEKDLISSIVNYQKALDMFCRLRDDSKGHYTAQTGSTHFALAYALVKNRNNQEAKKHFKEAIKSFETLNNTQFEPVMASCYFELGNLYTEEFNLHDAQTNYSKAEMLFLKFSDSDPAAYLPYYASVLNNLGVTFKSLGEFNKSAAYYEKALASYTVLAEKYNSSFRPYLAAAQNSLSILYGEMKDYEKAINLATDALNSYSELYREFPDEFLPYLATSLHNLGVFNLENGDLEKAEHAFDQSLAIRKKIAQEEPESFNADVCATLLNLIEIYYSRLENTLDHTFTQKSLELLRELGELLFSLNAELPVVKSMISDYQYYTDFFKEVKNEDLAFNRAIRNNEQIAERIFETRKIEQKAALQQEIVTGMEKLNEQYQDSDKIKNELAYAYNDLAWLLLRSGQFQDCEKIIKKALILEQPIPSLQCNLAHSYLFQNQFEKAEEIYRILSFEKTKNQESYRKIILEDFEKLKMDGVDHPDAVKISEMIKEI